LQAFHVPLAKGRELDTHEHFAFQQEAALPEHDRIVRLFIRRREQGFQPVFSSATKNASPDPFREGRCSLLASVFQTEK